MRTNAVLSEILPSPRQSLISLPFFVLTLFHSLSGLRYSYFLAELSVVSDFHFNNPSLTAQFNTILTFVFGCGLPVSFLCGVINDKLRSKFSSKLESLLETRKSSEALKAIQWYNARPAAISMYIYAVFALILSCLIFLPIEAAYYANFAFFLLMRGFYFTTNSITLFALFPLAQFGTVHGISSTISGVFACLQYALLKLHPTYADICALIVAVATFIPPSIIFIMSSKTLRKFPPNTEEVSKHSSDFSHFE